MRYFMLGLLMIVVISGCLEGTKDVAPTNNPAPLTDQQKIEAYNYSYASVQVFLNLIGATNDQFLSSQGLRKQFELYENGTMTDFIRSAEEKRAGQDMANRAASNAMIGGMLGGMLGSD